MKKLSMTDKAGIIKQLGAADKTGADNRVSSQQKAYIRNLKRYHSTITALRILLFIGFIAIWEISARMGWINAFIFSSPSRILKTFRTMIADGSIFRHTSITLGETFLSFGLIVVFGIGIALILWIFTPLSEVLEPYLIILNSLPKSALAPMLIVWLGNNSKAIIVTAISVAIFGTILNIYTSFSETDPDKIKLMKTFGANRLAILTKLIIPASLNTIVSNMKVNIGLCLVGVIIGEFLAARAGLGYLIMYGSQIFKLDWVAMSIVILCVISIILFKLIDLLQKAAKKLY